MTHTIFKGDTPEADKETLTMFANGEECPLPVTSVLELPNLHRYQYTPSYDEQGYTAVFERIR